MIRSSLTPFASSTLILALLSLGAFVAPLHPLMAETGPAAFNVASSLSAPLTGEVTVPSGSDVVTGVGTAFTTELEVGDLLSIADEVFRVQGIVSDTELQIDGFHTAGALGVTAFRGNDPLVLRDPHGKELVRVGERGNADVSGQVAVGADVGPSDLARNYGLQVYNDRNFWGAIIERTSTELNTDLVFGTDGARDWGIRNAGRSGSGILRDGLFIYEETSSTGSGKPAARLTIRAGGNVGIGLRNPQFLLHVNGDAAKPGGGSWSVPSDRRLKKDVTPFTRGLEDLVNLHPVYYRYAEDNPLSLPSGERFVGVVAQEAGEAIPEAVIDDEGEYLYLETDPVLWTMVNAIKELRARNEEARGAERSGPGRPLSARTGGQDLLDG